MKSLRISERVRAASSFLLLLPLIWLGCTFIFSAVLVTISGSGNITAIRTLIALGANMNAVDNKRTPLIYAIDNQSIKEAIVLINCGADVNFPNCDNQNTPLMGAAYYGQMPVVKFLISHGANINARDSSGESVLGWAEDGQKDGYGTEAAALLKKLGAVK